MRVAAIQLTAGADRHANLAQALGAVRDAAAAGARLIVLPEKWLAIGDGTTLAAAAQRLDGPLVAALAGVAAELEVDLIAGTIPEAPPAGDPDRRPWNTSLHVAPGGQLRAAYRKLHLFDAEIDGRQYRESAGERRGEHPVITTLADGTVAGLSVCFDLRFAPLYATLVAGGATLLTVPAAFTLATTRAHWEPLLRARAIDAGAWVIAANQAGQHPDGTRSGGQSMIVSPWGEVAARAPESGDAVVIADLDGAAVTDARSALPTRALVRPDAYARTPGSGLA
ncbi:MAG: nitrilase-related carbon-nitrogen hydrolase [Patulibacter sp.]